MASTEIHGVNVQINQDNAHGVQMNADSRADFGAAAETLEKIRDLLKENITVKQMEALEPVILELEADAYTDVSPAATKSESGKADVWLDRIHKTLTAGAAVATMTPWWSALAQLIKSLF